MTDTAQISLTERALKLLASGEAKGRREMFRTPQLDRLPIRRWPGWHYRVLSKLVESKLIVLTGSGAHVKYQATDTDGIKELLKDPEKLSGLLWTSPSGSDDLEDAAPESVAAPEPTVSPVQQEEERVTADPPGFESFMDGMIEKFGDTDRVLSTHEMMDIVKEKLPDFDFTTEAPNGKFGRYYISKWQGLKYKGYWLEAHKGRKGWYLRKQMPENAVPSTEESAAEATDDINPELFSLLNRIVDSLSNIHTSVHTVYNRIKKLEDQKDAEDQQKKVDHCSFCDKASSGKVLLFPGNGAAICNACITSAAILLKDGG
jgi:ClpX C4-type zinc finger.